VSAAVGTALASMQRSVRASYFVHTAQAHSDAGIPRRCSGCAVGAVGTRCASPRDARACASEGQRAEHEKNENQKKLDSLFKYMFTKMK